MLRRQHLTGIQVSQRSVFGEPYELLAGRNPDGPVCGQAVDEIVRHEWITPSGPDRTLPDGQMGTSSLSGNAGFSSGVSSNPGSIE
jgi:hypothetical protein